MYKVISFYAINASNLNIYANPDAVLQSELYSNINTYILLNNCNVFNIPVIILHIYFIPRML